MHEVYQNATVNIGPIELDFFSFCCQGKDLHENFHAKPKTFYVQVFCVTIGYVYTCAEE